MEVLDGSRENREGVEGDNDVVYCCGDGNPSITVCEGRFRGFWL